jgi:hypothetical protein
MVVTFSLLLGSCSVTLVGGQLSKDTVVGWAITVGILYTSWWNNTHVASSCKKKGMGRGVDDGRAIRGRVRRRQGQQASRRVVHEPGGQETTGSVPALGVGGRQLVNDACLLIHGMKAAGEVKRYSCIRIKYLRG